MSSVAPTRLSMIVPFITSRSLNCTFARRLPGVLWSAPVTTNNLLSIRTAWPRRTSLARMSLSFLLSCRSRMAPQSNYTTAGPRSFGRGAAAAGKEGKCTPEALRRKVRRELDSIVGLARQLGTVGKLRPIKEERAMDFTKLSDAERLVAEQAVL